MCMEAERESPAIRPPRSLTHLINKETNGKEMSRPAQPGRPGMCAHLARRAQAPFPGRYRAGERDCRAEACRRRRRQTQPSHSIRLLLEIGSAISSSGADAPSTREAAPHAPSWIGAVQALCYLTVQTMCYLTVQAMCYLTVRECEMTGAGRAAAGGLAAHRTFVAAAGDLARAGDFPRAGDLPRAGVRGARGEAAARLGPLAPAASSASKFVTRSLACSADQLDQKA